MLGRRLRRLNGRDYEGKTKGERIMNANRVSAEQLNAIKERAEKATPGPWHRMYKVGIEIHAENEWAPVIEEDVGVVRYSDADFIIKSREDIPQLVAEVERL